MDSEDSVFVNNFVFWDFKQSVPHVVIFQYGRLWGTKDVDIHSDIISLLEMTGLWEDYINIKKIINDEIAGETPQAINVHVRKKLGLFRIEFSRSKFPDICAVAYKDEEARWLTHGHSTKADLTIEKVRNLLIGINKWLLLQRVRAQVI